MSWNDANSPDEPEYEESAWQRFIYLATNTKWLLLTIAVAVVIGGGVVFGINALGNSGKAGPDSQNVVSSKTIRDEGPSLYISDQNGDNGRWVVVTKESYTKYDFGDEFNPADATGTVGNGDAPKEKSSGEDAETDPAGE